MTTGLRVGFALLLAASPALALDDAPFTAELSCQPEADSGRIVCKVDYRSQAARIVWADAVVTVAPPFVRPLRSRAAATVVQDGTRAGTGIALVSSARGSGRVSVRARAVICERDATDAGHCQPYERELGAELVLP